MNPFVRDCAYCGEEIPAEYVLCPRCADELANELEAARSEPFDPLEHDGEV